MLVWGRGRILKHEVPRTEAGRAQAPEFGIFQLKNESL